ncbi:hypothetical protein [Halobacillus yeomjeoni]|uniref:Uncharacterized protein n=1 Tax=Halobacillus yeomjeoni TaxID=311194 RepID=A0A931HX26_9BACI|nr:hypothetical protein [Halobacillus yeomjeoni]MBH0231139.1 hypothetical protein [Halobacillus yeomjeoni]
MKHRIIEIAVVVIAFSGWFFLMDLSYEGLETAKERFDGLYMYYYIFTSLGVLFGILLEYKKVIQLFKGNWKLDWTLLFSVSLLILAFIISPWNILQWFSADPPLFIEVFSMPQTELILPILAGVMLVRSLTREEREQR